MLVGSVPQLCGRCAFPAEIGNSDVTWRLKLANLRGHVVLRFDDVENDHLVFELRL